MSAAASKPPAGVRLPRLRAGELLGTALQGLRTRRLRAALSALGIAIGIGAMVAVVGISSCAQANLLAEIDALGTNLLTVTPGQTLTGAGEIFPATASAQISHQPGVDRQRSRLPRLKRERVPHPIRARRADRRAQR